MSLDTVLAGLAELGLKPYLDAGGKPRLSGPAAEITDAVREVLGAYREDLLARLQAEAVPVCARFEDEVRGPLENAGNAAPAPSEGTDPTDPTEATQSGQSGQCPTPSPPLRTWYWPRGHTYREVPGDDAFGNPDWHPVGSWWFRSDGDPKLRAVPGRPGAWAITTEVCA